MKTLHFCMSRGWGGLEMASFQWAKLFKNHGHVSDSVAFPGSPLAQKLISANLPLNEMSISGRFSPLNSWKLRKLVQENGYDAIFLQSLKDLWIVSPALYDLPTQIIGFAQMWLSGINKNDFLHRFIYQRMDGLVLLTPRQGEQVLKCIPYAKENTFILPNAVDIKKFNPQFRSENFRKQWKFNNDDFVVGIVGRIDPQKGHRELLLAFAQWVAKYPGANLKLLIVGDPTPDSGVGYLQELQNLCEKPELKNRVVFTGFRSDVAEIMANLDLFVLNSYQEAFGFVVVEAMMSGTPVIATNSGGVPDVLGDGQYGTLVPPQNISELAGALENVWKNTDERISKAQQARLFALKHYDENTNYQKMVSWIKNRQKERGSL